MFYVKIFFGRRLFGSSRINVKSRFGNVSVRAVGATPVAQNRIDVRLASHLQSAHVPYLTIIRDEPPFLCTIWVREMEIGFFTVSEACGGSVFYDVS